MEASSLARYGLMLVLLLVAGATAIQEEPDSSFVFVPTQFMTCVNNFKSHADLSVGQCKAMCFSLPSCTEFSYPLEDAPTGCRMGQAGGCKIEPLDNELSSVYKKQKSPGDEPPDLEGPGARRRRRSDSRRRTHSPEKTAQTDEINQIVNKAKAEAETRRLKELARAEGEEEAVLYHKEGLAKKDVASRSLAWEIKQKMLKDVKKPAKKGEDAKSSMSELATLQGDLKADHATQLVLSTNIRDSDQNMEVTNSQKAGVFAKIENAQRAIKTLMDDPGKLADQDRQIAVAILGKLRVAKALVNGDLLSLKPHQKKLDWVVSLKEATEKAVRHPSKENLAAAKQAYKEASKQSSQEALNAAAAQAAEARRLAAEAAAAQDAAASDAKKAANKHKAAEEAAAAATAAAQEAADKIAAAAQKDSIVVAKAAKVAAVKPKFGPKPIIRKIKRGFFDPIE